MSAAGVCQAADQAPKPASTKASKGAAKAAVDAPAEDEARGGGPDKSGPPPASSSPMAELKKSNAALDKVLRKDRPDWSPEAELQRAEVRKVVGSFLDYGELARRSLARHWDTLTVKQRQDFVNTLRQLVERSYLRQMHSSPNYNIKYEKEEKTGSEASVTATLNTVSRGKKVVVALDYKMMWKEGHWVVYDVLTDDQSMLENYRAEFNKIITKESFDALLNKMKKKLDEKDEE
ncbi:MAG TPA: ABC transporter substrate-binding protein [Polyangia bacterium]|nr:ABC transporter substrate-binding protein [Polyangia bacterium]